MDKLVITRLQGKICTASVSDRKVTGIILEEEDQASILNNIYIGKVQKVVAGINAAFIDLGVTVGYYSLDENKEHIFTHQGRSGKLRPGDELLVQISRDAVKTKAPVLTSNLSLPGRFCVLTAGRTGIGFSAKLTDTAWKNQIRRMLLENDFIGFGIILRTNAGSAGPEQILEECEKLKAMLKQLIKESGSRTCYSCLYKTLPSYIAGIRDSYAGGLEEIVTDCPDLYGQLKEYLETSQAEDAGKLKLYTDRLLSLGKLYSLDNALSKALDKRVWLKSGGYLVIEPTEAMVVIDVNTGKYEGKKKLEETVLKINLEAAAEIARQLRLRNLSGIIMVDFIDMNQEESKMQLMEALKAAVAKDPVKTVVVEMTRLNLVEITRKKVRRPLYEQAAGLYNSTRE